MASILEWQRAGVAIKVELNANKALTLVSEPTDMAFTPGGSEGGPLGWSPGYWGSPPATTADYDLNTTAGGVVGIYAIQSTAKFGSIYRYVPAQANVRYQFQVEARVMAGKSDSSRYVEIAEWNGTQANVLASTSFTNITNTNFELVSLQASRAVNVAGGYTQLRIRCDASASFNVANAVWGINYQNPVLYARSLSMPAFDWRDVTCDVKALTTRYGRERFTNRYDVATMQLVFNNEDGIYTYAEPHPFNFGPGRQLRVSATYMGTRYPIAYGVVDTINDAVSLDGKAVTNVSTMDVTNIGSNAPQSVSGPASQGGYRIAQLADLIGYLYTRLDGGVFNMQPLTPSGRSVRDEMGLTADSEGGAVFADREGYIAFKDRNWRTTDDNLKSVTANVWAKPSSNQPYFDGVPDQAGLPTLCANRLSTDWSMSRVINSLSLANAGGTAKEYKDRPSMRQHGERTYQRHDFVLALASDLDQRATDIMTGYTQPVMRLNSLSFRPDLDENDWPWALSVFLNYLVRVWYQNTLTGWGWIMVTHVQSVEHRITPTTWETTLALDLPVYYGDAPMQDVYAWDQPGATWDGSGVWI